MDDHVTQGGQVTVSREDATPCGAPAPRLRVLAWRRSGRVARPAVGRGRPMKISVVGCGYLGAVHAASMAQLGHEVVGIDVDLSRIDSLHHGKAPFYEPGFDDLLAESLSSGRLTFSADVTAAAEAEVHFVCVGTPQKRGEYAADLC